MPGFLATRSEAPSISHACILMSGKLRRGVHTLSLPERAFVLLGLFHPAVVGLQEQRWIPGHRLPHPLAAWPDADPVGLPGLKGLEEVASEHGFERFLRSVNVTTNHGETMKVTCPWFGDLLWAIRGSANRLYCINWTIKDTQESFRRRKKRIATAERPDDEQAIARLVGERAHYASAGIPTYPLSRDEIPPDLESNLLQLFLHHNRPVTLTAGQQAELQEKFQAAQDLGVPPAEVITRFRSRHDVTVHEPRTYFYRLIWERCLLVDLFRPLLIDRPMTRMTKDPVIVFANWFRPEGGEQ